MSPEPEIDPRKFVEYSMNPNHSQNQGKWIAFAALGYDVQSIEGRSAATQDVIAQLRQRFATAPSIPGQNTPWGSRFQRRIRIQGPNGKEGDLVTSWQLDLEESNPRLITNWLEVYPEEMINNES